MKNVYIHKYKLSCIRAVGAVAAVALLLPGRALAHCPLCTAGAGAAAIGAAWLGVSQTVIGIFIGAFAVAIGLWIGGLVKKKYIPYQDNVIAIFSFATTVFPLLPMMIDVTSVYVGIGSGAYGTAFNNVYLINLFLVGSIIGAAIMFGSPMASKWVREQRGGKQFPYQGIAITFLLLLLASLVVELVM